LELYSNTNNVGYLNDANKAAGFTLQNGRLTDNSAGGILKDEGGGDGGLFKGIFVRYFTRLIVDGNIDNGLKTQYINFLKRNAQAVWLNGNSRPQLLFGSAWNRSPGSSNEFTVQLSGLMLLEAMAELKKLNLVE
jgi:predicted alpha-1,6-mannanase (GH76 family)